jgi:hypothetical protein
MIKLLRRLLAPFHPHHPTEAELLQRQLDRKAMARAYNLGQTYWQQADHEFISQQRKADATEQRFREFADSICAQYDAALAARDERVIELEAGLREIAVYPTSRDDEMGINGARSIARALLAPPDKGADMPKVTPTHEQVLQWANDAKVTEEATDAELQEFAALAFAAGAASCPVTTGSDVLTEWECRELVLHYQEDGQAAIREAARIGAKRERERAARVCETWTRKAGDDQTPYCCDMSQNEALISCAAAIRRGEGS